MSKNKNNKPEKKEPVNESEPRVDVEDVEDVETFDTIPDEEGLENEEEKDEINDLLNKMNQLQQQVEDEKSNVEKQKKDYLFLMAEFDNFRKRTVREKGELIKNAEEGALKDLLPIIDDFERAIEANKESTDVEAIKEGTDLIYQKLVKYLDKHGVKAIESTGKPFDAEMHEAIATVPTGDEEQKGTVIDTVTKGYMMGDKVLRHAKVAVGS